MFNKEPTRGVSQRSKEDQPTIPTWLTLVFGTLLGLFIIVLLYLWQPWKPSKSAAPTPSTAPVAETQKNNDDYRFYDLLPDQQTTASPNQAIQTEPVPSENTAATEEPTDNAQTTVEDNATNTEINETIVIENTQYILQVRSFADPQEASARRAEIILNGLQARVVENRDNSGTLWYRVISGPYGTEASAINAQKTLQNNGIDSIIVKK